MCLRSSLSSEAFSGTGAVGVGSIIVLSAAARCSSSRVVTGRLVRSGGGGGSGTVVGAEAGTGGGVGTIGFPTGTGQRGSLCVIGTGFRALTDDSRGFISPTDRVRRVHLPWSDSGGETSFIASLILTSLVCPRDALDGEDGR